MTARRRRKASGLGDVERALYLGARMVGDAEALDQGGVPKLAERVARRKVRRVALGWLSRKTRL
jgi:hypothetical protein